MQRAALLLPLVAIAAIAALACGPTRGAGEPAAAFTEQRFTSNESVLLDFELDGRLAVDTEDPSAVRALIEAQLMYSIGPLNGDRSVGRHERLEISAVTTSNAGEVRYHAKLPVAWGRLDAIPSTYELTLPARVTEADQIAFAESYGATCVDPEAGEAPIHPARMFLFYRPRKNTCELAASDVVSLSAKVTRSVENTKDKYPEYDRIWDDDALRVVAVFTRAESLAKTGLDDEGAHAYEAFLARAHDHLRALSPRPVSSGDGRLMATLSDGRLVVIAARLVADDLRAEGPAFDAWYDAQTPEADLVLFNGHAGLGENVRALMKKGTFRAGKYVIWSVNGCDTFAYVDRTLADRRALLNPDDPGGTKYMDVVSNVMAGYFTTGPDTSLTLIDAALGRRKAYREIFADIDPEQIVAVTGEEDNEFQPAPEPAPAPAARPVDEAVAGEAEEDDSAASAGAPEERFASCSSASAAPARRRATDLAGVLAVALLFVCRRASCPDRAVRRLLLWRR